MKLQPDRMEGVNVISAHNEGAVAVSGTIHRTSIVVPWVGEVQPWGAGGFAGLTEVDFSRLADWQPELVVFGSGARLQFARPALMRALMERRIGVETMDTKAACRTYNILAGEGRRVVAALLIE